MMPGKYHVTWHSTLSVSVLNQILKYPIPALCSQKNIECELLRLPRYSPSLIFSSIYENLY